MWHVDVKEETDLLNIVEWIKIVISVDFTKEFNIAKGVDFCGMKRFCQIGICNR